jgi:hypothetical protein
MIDDELADVRAQVRDSEPFSPAVTAQVDALHTSVHEQLQRRGIHPASRECEQTWLVAGGALAQLLLSPGAADMLASIANDEQRGGIAALLLWSAGISPHRVEHAW